MDFGDNGGYVFFGKKHVSGGLRFKVRYHRLILVLAALVSGLLMGLKALGPWLSPL